MPASLAPPHFIHLSSKMNLLKDLPWPPYVTQKIKIRLCSLPCLILLHGLHHYLAMYYVFKEWASQSKQA